MSAQRQSRAARVPVAGAVAAVAAAMLVSIAASVSASAQAQVAPAPTTAPKSSPTTVPTTTPTTATATEAAATSQHSADAQRVFQQVAPAIVTVLGYDESGAVSTQGSGVALGGGRVVSNCHVVQDATRLELISGAERLAARWLRADPSRDVCLLEAAGLPATAVPIRPLAGLAVGERVYAVGNPLGFGLAVSSGLITQFAEVGGERVILSSAAQSPGSSGGGLFDQQGRLIGLITGVFTAGQNLNIALPAEWIGELDARGIAPPVAAAAPPPEPSWFDEAMAMQQVSAWHKLEQHARAWLQTQPGAARAHLSLAVALLNQDHVDEAERAVREALRHDERLAAAWHYLGLVLHRQGKRAEAERALDRALEFLPASPSVYQTRAFWLLEDGDAARALPQAERALALDPRDPRHWSLLGTVRQRLGDSDAAIRAYRAALGLNERDETSRNALARLLAGRGDDAAAHRALVERSGGHTESRTWIAIGEADYNRQRYAPAEAAFRKATEAAPESSVAWALLGQALARLQRDDEAAPAFERALQLDAAAVTARLERSNLRARRGDLAGALDDARRATQTAPDQAQAWRVLAAHAVQATDWNTAADAYRRLDALGQATIDDFASFGDTLARLGQRAAALEVFARGEAIDARHAALLVNMAAFHGRGGDLARAEQYLKRALEVEPRNATATSSLGYLQLQRGMFDESVKTLERAVLLDPASANAWINLGHASLRHRNVGRAITALDKALQLKPDALDAHLYASQAFLAISDGAKALHHAETVLAKQPEFAPALALATLANLMQGREQAAASRYGQLQRHAPQIAREIRAQAIKAGLAGASKLPQ